MRFPQKKEEYGNHLLLVGWHPFSKVIKGTVHYWVPPLDNEVDESSEEDTSEGDSGEA